MEIKRVPYGQIKPYESNPRLNDGAVDAVAESIRQCGYCAPIVVDENMVILAGHTRHKALGKLGYTDAEVCVVSGLTSDQKRKYRILDNKTNELAQWDFELLEQELAELDFDGFDFGFDFPETAEPKTKENTENIYTGKINVPQYEITGKEVSISGLIDTSKTDALIKEIENSNVSDEEKTFLKASAYRHARISFDDVAEYYARASEEMQNLMEKQALVILDYGDALKYGYVRLSDKLDEIAGDADA